MCLYIRWPLIFLQCIQSLKMFSTSCTYIIGIWLCHFYNWYVVKAKVDSKIYELLHPSNTGQGMWLGGKSNPYKNTLTKSIPFNTKMSCGPPVVFLVTTWSTTRLIGMTGIPHDFRFPEVNYHRKLMSCGIPVVLLITTWSTTRFWNKSPYDRNTTSFSVVNYYRQRMSCGIPVVLLITTWSTTRFWNRSRYDRKRMSCGIVNYHMNYHKIAKLFSSMTKYHTISCGELPQQVNNCMIFLWYFFYFKILTISFGTTANCMVLASHHTCRCESQFDRNISQLLVIKHNLCKWNNHT